MSLGAALIAGLLLGLANAAHCAGMCGAFAVHAAARGPRRGLSLYGLGKTCTYAFLGALAGTAGAGLGTLGESARLLLGALVVGTLLIAAWNLLRGDGVRARPPGGAWLGDRLAPVVRRLRTLDLPGGRFTLGATTGLLPCGVTALALLAAAAQGSALRGVAVLVAFGLGTLPALVAVATLGRALAGRLRPRPLRVAAGVLLLAVAVITGLRATMPWPVAGGAPATTASRATHTTHTTHAPQASHPDAAPAPAPSCPLCPP